MAGVSIFTFCTIESPITRVLSSGFSVGASLSVENLFDVLITNSSQVETPMRMTSMQMSFPETVSVFAEILWLCKPIVKAAVRVAGLRRSWR